MEYHISCDWVGDMAFDTQIDDHTLRIDSGPEGKNTGPSPKRLVAAGLAGCTAMDVAHILKKMRIEYDSFRVEIRTPITEEHPKTFDHIYLKYILTGEDIPRSKVEKAVTLSQEKYCGVSEMLRKHCDIAWEIEIR